MVKVYINECWNKSTASEIQKKKTNFGKSILFLIHD